MRSISSRSTDRDHPIVPAASRLGFVIEDRPAQREGAAIQQEFQMDRRSAGPQDASCDESAGQRPRPTPIRFAPLVLLAASFSIRADQRNQRLAFSS